MLGLADLRRPPDVLINAFSSSTSVSWELFVFTVKNHHPPGRRSLDHRQFIEDPDRFQRTLSTKRVLPNVQSALNRTKSLRLPSQSYQKRYISDGFQSAPRRMNSPSYLESQLRGQKTPIQTKQTGYRQASTASSNSKSLSPNRFISRGGLRHQPRSLNSSENSQRPRRQLPVAAPVSETDESPSVVSRLDDFDYFCSISYPQSSKPSLTPLPAVETAQTRRQRMKGMRSYSMLHPTDTDAEGTQPSESVVDARRSFIRAMTQDPDPIETPRIATPVKPSRHNSSVNLAHASHSSPGCTPTTPQPPPHIPQGLEGSPLGAAISQEALDADDPDLVGFKVQLVGSHSVGKTTICQRLGNLNRRADGTVGTCFRGFCVKISSVLQMVLFIRA